MINRLIVAQSGLRRPWEGNSGLVSAALPALLRLRAGRGSVGEADTGQVAAPRLFCGCLPTHPHTCNTIPAPPFSDSPVLNSRPGSWVAGGSDPEGVAGRQIAPEYFLTLEETVRSLGSCPCCRFDVYFRFTTPIRYKTVPGLPTSSCLLSPQPSCPPFPSTLQ